MKPGNLVNKTNDTVNDFMNGARKRNIMHLYTEDESYNGRQITVNRKKLINFSSCSYMGLDIDERIKEGAVSAIRKYGVQFSSSRAYLSCTLYKEWEYLLEQMFKAPVIISTAVSLGHHAVVPVVIEPGDAVIMDQQVHASVQDAILKMQLKGIDVSIIRHNSLEELEIKIQETYQKHHRIWYAVDGVYSMYGDYSPIKQLEKLIQKYNKLHLYIDDAHGMSIAGPNGTGYILSQVPIHERMILGTSLNKAFATGGAAFIIPDRNLALKIKNCGGPMIFSGPNQIPVIGAGIASAKIHLTNEIYEKQRQLKEKTTYCHYLLEEKYRLPVISQPETPIFFIGLGLLRVGYNLIQKMQEDGCFVNLALFPAVPEACTGLRFTITNHHTLDDIEDLAFKIAKHFPKALKEENRTIKDIYRSFRRIKQFNEDYSSTNITPIISEGFYIKQFESIQEISQTLWNNIFSTDSSYDWEFLLKLEDIFAKNVNEEDNWKFIYYIIYDRSHTPLLATFFTITISKDDFLSAPNISYKVEIERLINPYYLTSKTLMMGSLITEGLHLYIDKSKNWKKALIMLMDEVWKIQEKEKINNIVFRDFPESDTELMEFFNDQGFIKINMPENNIIKNINWTNIEDYLSKFNAKKRKYIKVEVLEKLSLFELEKLNRVSKEELGSFYRLYQQVKSKSLELNTFPLPYKFFERLIELERCEILKLSLKKNRIPICYMLTYKTEGNNYVGIVIGMNYEYLKQYNLYKQALYHFVMRAQELKSKKAMLGFTSSQTKKKFGSETISTVSYVQTLDTFNRNVISNIANQSEPMRNGIPA